MGHRHVGDVHRKQIQPGCLLGNDLQTSSKANIYRKRKYTIKTYNTTNEKNNKNNKQQDKQVWDIITYKIKTINTTENERR